MQLRESIKRYLREQCFMNPNSPPTYGNYGCMDPAALNFDVAATHPCSAGYPSFACQNCNSQPDYCGPGTGVGQCCIYPQPILGCTDLTACNYDPTATIDDGSCEYTSCLGCTDQTANNYNQTATIDDGSCTYDVYGCIDPTACNPCQNDCNQDDGSCEYTSCMGCTDPTAINYDQTATISCSNCCVLPLYGCTDILALNYDVNANIDDGSCIYDLEPCCEWCDTGPPQGSTPPLGCVDWMCNNVDYCPPEIISDNPCDKLEDYVLITYPNWQGTGPLDVTHFCEKCQFSSLNDSMCKCCKKDPCDKILFTQKVNDDYNLLIPEFCKYCMYDTIQDPLCKCCKRFEKMMDKKKLKEEINLIKKIM